MQNINKVFFLAAGLGTRLKPFTDQMAKPAIPFWGLPQMLYPYRFTRQLNLKQWAYNTHHHRQSVQEALARFHLNDGHEFFEPQLLDSGGGIFNARSFLETEEHFLVINADSLFVYQDLVQFEQEIKAHQTEGRLATLFTIDKEGAGVEFSGLYSHKGQLTGAGLHPKPTDVCSHYIGIGLFSKRIFAYLNGEPQNIIHDVLKPIASTERVQVSILKDWDWYELGKTKDFIQSFQSVKTHLSSGRYSADSFSSFYKTQNHFNPQWNAQSFTPSGIEKEILDSL